MEKVFGKGKDIMMKNESKCLLLTALFAVISLIWCSKSSAQVKKYEIDSLMIVVDGKEADHKEYGPIDTISWNPTTHIHQKRFLPKGLSFRTPHWWQQLYIGLSSGLYGITDKEWQKTNVPVSLSMGYEFNRHSGLRLSSTYVQIPRSNTRQQLQSLGIDLDYTFNLTNYMYGYNPNRIFNFGVVPGIGLIYASRHNEHSLTLKAQLGFHFGLFLGQTTEVYAEPWFGLTDDKVNLSVNNPAAYDILYGLRIGTAVRLRPRSVDCSPDSTNHKPFFEYAQGFALPIGLTVKGKHTVGTSYRISLGEWINPVFGFRIGIAASQYYWDAITEEKTVVDGIQVHPSYQTWYTGANISGRLEIILNPLNFGKNKEGIRDWDLNIGLGAEYGWLIKNGVPGTECGIRKYYYGLTAAPQLLYRFDSRNSFFIEPRVSLVYYNIPYSNTDGSKAYSDKLLNFMAGVRIQPLASWERELFNDKFKKKLWLSASIGTMCQIKPYKLVGDGHFNIDSQVGIAYEFAPLVGLHFRTEYMRFSFNEMLKYNVYDYAEPIEYYALWKKNYNIISLKLSYLLNMNSLLQGYRKHPRMNVFLELGPLFSMNIHRRYSLNEGELAGGDNLAIIDDYAKINNVFGGFGGLLLDFRINDKWSLQAQTELSIYPKTGFLQHFPKNKWSNWALQCSIGAAYHINIKK